VGLIEADLGGRYVRTPHGVGYVFGRDCDQDQIALVQRDEEVTHPASDLIEWTPAEGEPVVTQTEYRLDGSIVDTKIEPVWSADVD
jgi:hypothetical protein